MLRYLRPLILLLLLEAEVVGVVLEHRLIVPRHSDVLLRAVVYGHYVAFEEIALG